MRETDIYQRAFRKARACLDCRLTYSHARTFLVLGMVMMRETLKQLKTIQLAVIIIVMHQEELNLSLGFLKNR